VDGIVELFKNVGCTSLALVHSAHVLFEKSTEETLSELNTVKTHVLEICSVVMDMESVLVGLVVGVVWLDLLKEWHHWFYGLSDSVSEDSTETELGRSNGNCSN